MPGKKLSLALFLFFIPFTKPTPAPKAKKTVKKKTETKPAE